MKLVIDADSIVYSLAFSCQDWGVTDEEGNIIDIFSLKSDAIQAKELESDTLCIVPRAVEEVHYYTNAFLENIIDNFDKVDEVNLWLTYPNIKNNFRYAVNADYKGNRKDFEKPHHYGTVRSYLIGRWGASLARVGWEADDELSAIGWKAYREDNTSVVLCSIDKDLDTAPGWHYRWPTHNKQGDLYYLDEDTAVKNFWVQVLTGDKADNIAGLHRVGEKRARSFLERCVTEKQHYDTCVNYWVAHKEKEGMTEEEAIKAMHNSCQLLYLMRSDDDTGWEKPE